MAVRPKSFQKSKQGGEKSQMQLAREERVKRQRVLQLKELEQQRKDQRRERIATLLVRADRMLLIIAPDPNDFPATDAGHTCFEQAHAQWQDECLAVIELARRAGKPYQWNPEWAHDGRLMMTCKRIQG